MPPKFRENRSIKRTSGKKKPNVKIYVFCEGKNTEPDFIKEYSEIYGNNMIEVFLARAQGVPKSIVKNAIEKKNVLDRIAKKSNDKLDKKFQVWAVFDRDEHPEIPNALQSAKSNNIKVAFSSPCFEIWALAHFIKQTAEIGRKEAQSALKKYLSGYDPKNNKTISAAALEKLNKYDDVVQEFKKISLYHDECSISMIDKNPYTDIHVLLDKIKNNGKPK